MNKPLWGEVNKWTGSESDFQRLEAGADDMQALLESDNALIEPLDFSGSTFPYEPDGILIRFLQTPGKEDSVMAVTEAAVVWSWRHAEVLHAKLKSGRSEYEYRSFAEDLMCMEDAYRARFIVADEFDIRDHHLLVPNNIDDHRISDNELTEGSGTLSQAYTLFNMGAVPDSLSFLILVDLWRDEPIIRKLYRETPNQQTSIEENRYTAPEWLYYPRGAATADDELIQKLRIHFGRGGMAAVQARAEQNERGNSFLVPSANFWNVHQEKMRILVCEALRGSRPQGLAVSLSDGNTVLTWTAATYDVDSLTGYRILRGDGYDGAMTELVADTKSLNSSWTDQNPSPGGNVYAVQALYGKYPSPRSNSATTAPGPVRNLSATAEIGRVTLDWDSPEGNVAAAGFRIRRGADEDSLSLLVADTGSAQTSHVDETVTSGETYTYSVTALSGQMHGPEVIVSAGTVPLPPTDASLKTLEMTGVPLTFDPQNTQYTANVENQVSQTTITATASDDGASYRIKLGDVVDEDGTVPLAEGENAISVEVTARDGVTIRSYTVTVVRADASANNPATGEPTIAGTARVGETLTAGTSGISDDDGMDNATFSYQWLHNDGGPDTEIAGATSATYLVTSGEVGKTIKVLASFTDDGGNEESLTSVATAPVAATVPGVPRSAAAEQGSTGELDVSWEAPAANGGSDITGYTVQWKEAAHSWDMPANVSEATTSDNSYTISLLSLGTEYSVRVIATNSVGDGPPSSEVKETAEAQTSQQQAAPQNSPATGQVAILGTAQVGQTLTVMSAISDQDGLANANFTHQWVRVDGATETDISGATGTTYTTVRADQGKTVKVRVSFTDDAGYQETLTSVATTTVAPRPNSPATGQVAILGTAQVGQTLTVMSAISDQDGLANANFTHQWVRVDGATETDISGATGTTYTTVRADQGKTVKVRVSFTDDAGYQETLTSVATTTVAPRPNSPATGQVAILGTAQVGQTLTVMSAISDQDGLANANFTHQWVRVDGATETDISGATGTTYTTVRADQGKTVKVRVSFTDDAGYQETLTSVATTTVAPRPNSPATGQVAILGTAQVGQTLTVMSAISDQDGLANANFTHQWVRVDGATETDISGATGTTYTTVRADQGKTVKVRVSFTDDAGYQETLTSVATTTVAPRPNRPATGQVAILGTAQVGQTLTILSAISDQDGLDNANFTHQWVRIDGTTETDIGGATGTTYTTVRADGGKSIRTRISFTDDAGYEETLTSPAVLIPRPPLTATLQTDQVSHDGQNSFTVTVTFSEQFPVSYTTIRNHLLDVDDGQVNKAKRSDPESAERNRVWNITIAPAGDEDVVIRLQPTTDCEDTDAICTPDGRKLSTGLTTTVSGPEA